MNCVGKIVYEGKCVRGRDVTVLDCVVCGFKHVHPLPTEEQMQEYYKKQYFETEKPNYEHASGTLSEYQKIVDDKKLVVAGIPREPIFKGVSQKRVLDVGCGPTAPFLQHICQNPNVIANKSHNIISGIEPSLPVIMGGWQMIKQSEMWMVIYRSWEVMRNHHPDMKFDIIHLGFVMEHLVNPMAMLLKCKEHLDENGVLIIESPNDFNPLQMAIWDGKSVPWWVSTPDHINYFTPQTMMTLLERAGLRNTQHVETTYPVEHFLLTGLDYRVDAAAAKAVRDRRANCQAMWQASQGGIYPHLHGRTFWVATKVKEDY